MIPVFGYCFFIVSSDGLFNEIIVFEYLDEGEEYASLLANREGVTKELSKLKANMQSFIDKEIVRVNGERVYPKVVGVNIGIKDCRKHAYVLFHIEFKGRLRINNFNVYEDTYEPDKADYDYIVTWKLPKGSRVIEADFGFNVSIRPDNVLTFRVSKGDVTPGYEKLVFYLQSI